LAETGRHPAPRTQKPLKQRRQIKIGVEARKVQPETGWTDVDHRQIRGFCLFQSLRLFWRERDVYARAQRDDDAAEPPVVASRNGRGLCGTSRRSPGICLFVLLTANHELFSQ